MSTSSGAAGFCKNAECRHANNEHKIRVCRSYGCRVRWKRCQVAGKCNGVHYRICKKCVAHPAAEPDWGWSGFLLVDSFRAVEGLGFWRPFTRSLPGGSLVFLNLSFIEHINAQTVCSNCCIILLDFGMCTMSALVKSCTYCQAKNMLGRLSHSGSCSVFFCQRLPNTKFLTTINIHHSGQSSSFIKPYDMNTHTDYDNSNSMSQDYNLYRLVSLVDRPSLQLIDFVCVIWTSISHR